MKSDPGLFRQVDEAIRAREREIVEATQALIQFETVSVDLTPGSDHTENDEGGLQEWIAARFRRAGLNVDQWEPDAQALMRHPMIPEWHHWRGRPITVATLAGHGSGRSLIINGHVDVVDPGDPRRWSVPPFSGVVRDGRIVGRGSADMKGGIAAALVAVETLVDCGIRLEGDVIFEVVGDEETGGMGTIAAAERGYRADAAVCPEPTGFKIWAATRGIIHAQVTVPGRSAHAELNQPEWQAGGGVNANHKALKIAQALVELGTRWNSDDQAQHMVLGPPTLNVTKLHGGEFISNLPERCELAINATYLPQRSDDTGFGSRIRAELEEALAKVCADDRDGWLRHDPPSWRWLLDYPAYELEPGSDIVEAVQRAAQALPCPSSVSGTDSGYDGALLSVLYGIPGPAFGPGELGEGHTTDESVAVVDLVNGARAYAHLLLDWCGHR